MLHKLLTAAAVLFAAGSLYAQKPVAAAVTDIEDNPSNGLEMCRSLFNEYYLSELTTHSKINMLDTASTQSQINKLELSRGQDLSAEQIKKLCQALKTDALCLLKMSRGKNSTIVATLKIVDKDGKTAGTVTATLKGIGDTDSVSRTLAISSAKILRKIRGISEKEERKSDEKEPTLPSTVTPI